MNKTSHIVSALSLGVLLLAVSCSSQFSDICDKQIDCEGGNDKDRDACVAQVKASENIASDYDCSDPFDKYIDCVATIPCSNGKFDPDELCKEQQKVLSACAKASTGKKTSDSTATASSGGQ